MKTIQVALCGAPMVGKTALLHIIAKTIMQGEIKTEHFDDVHFTSFEFKLKDILVRIKTISGAFTHHEKYIPLLITDAQVIIYMLSVPNSFKKKPIAPSTKTQQWYYDLYIKYINELGLSWNNVSWLLILNKIDLGSEYPRINNLPSHLYDTIMQCVAIKGLGVTQILLNLSEISQAS